MALVRTSSVTDENNVPVSGATIYVYNEDGTSAAIYSDAVRTLPITQPITTDQFGTYSYYAADGVYREDTWYGGKLRYREIAPVGEAANVLANADAIARAETTTTANAGSSAASATAAATAETGAQAAQTNAQNINQAVSDALATGTVSGLVGTRIYTSRAALNADLTPADALYALVCGDATAANNDLYKKSGASGTGSWTGPLGFFAAASAQAQQYATNAANSATTAQSAATNLQPSVRLETEFGFVDTNGYAIPLGSTAGYEHSFSLSDCETIPHWGNSISEGPSYDLPNKGIISRVSNFSPYRHINLGLSGDTTSKICERLADNRETIVANTSWTWAVLGATSHAAFNARFAVLMSFVNENPTTWVQNAPKVLEMFKDIGAQPVIVSEAETSAASYEWDQQVIMTNLARKYQADFIDVRFNKDELAAPTNASNPFWLGVHPGTRAAMIYAAPLIEWTKTLPKPRRSIKLYSVRSSVAVGSVADLVFDSIESMVAKFQEISVGHKYIATANQDWFQELDKHTFTSANSSTQNCQYNALQTGAQLTLGAYALVRIAVPGHARSLEGVALELGTNATGAYVLDKFASNTSNTDTPPGAWTALTISGRLIPVSRDLLQRSMRGNELCILLFNGGGVTVARPVVHYSGSADMEPRVVRRYDNPGPELLTTQTTASLAGWTTQGTPATVVPFDLGYGCPRIPGTTNPITGVAEVTSANTIGQAAVLSQTNKDFATFRIRVWARYWPLVYLDNTLYSFPSGQVLDRSAGAVFTDNAIKGDSFDFSTLRLQTAVNAGGVGTPNAYEKQDQLVGLYWTPIDFFVSVSRAATNGTTFNFNLSSPDGTIQIGKVSIREVSEYVDRC